MKNYYRILGVPRNATAEQIKQAYRKLIRVCHPDVNSSPKAAEWARELNEAYTTLSDLQAKTAHDMDLRLQESERQESSPRPASTPRGRAESKPPPRAEPNFCCERCGRVDSSLRVSVTWRVFSFLNYSRKSPAVKILCGECRLKESLAASATTVLLGWWSLWGFFWTLEALFKNARSGDQPTENNATLLNALGYQLYRAGRYQQAYEALVAAFKLMPDPKTAQAINSLKPHLPPADERSFWERFRKLELHPVFYHVPVGAVGILLLGVGLNALNASSSSEPSRETQAAYAPQYQSRSSQPPGSIPQQPDLRPTFSEPEEPMPEQGALELGDRVFSYRGVTAPLEIATRASDGNYVMKVVDWNTGEFVATYFIKRGSTLSTKLPPGVYKLKFASGDKWFGAKFLFGPRTSYSYIRGEMVFYLSGDYANGHRIELIPQEGGNLDSRPMSAEQW